MSLIRPTHLAAANSFLSAMGEIDKATVSDDKMLIELAWLDMTLSYEMVAWTDVTLFGSKTGERESWTVEVAVEVMSFSYDEQNDVDIIVVGVVNNIYDAVGEALVYAYKQQLNYAKTYLADTENKLSTLEAWEAVA